jgi:hypothetical protein
LIKSFVEKTVKLKNTQRIKTLGPRITLICYQTFITATTKNFNAQEIKFIHHPPNHHALPLLQRQDSTKIAEAHVANEKASLLRVDTNLIAVDNE